MNKSSCKIMEKSAMKTEEMTTWEFSPEALRKALKRKGMSNNEFAHRVGVIPLTVSNWLHGKMKPSPKHLNKISEVLELDSVMKFSPNKLQNLLIYRHLTLHDLSGMTGIAFSTFRRWILRKGSPSVPSIRQICKVLSINEEELYEKEGEETKRLVFDPKKCRQLISRHYSSFIEASEHCGIDFTVLEEWCSGNQNPHFHHLEKLTRTCNVPIESLFSEDITDSLPSGSSRDRLAKKRNDEGEDQNERNR